VALPTVVLFHANITKNISISAVLFVRRESYEKAFASYSNSFYFL